MPVMSARMEFEPELGAAMAWVSFAIGGFVAMVVAILAYNFLPLPIWTVLLIYPVMGTMVALAVLIVLYLRSGASQGDTLTGRKTKTDFCHGAVSPANRDSSFLTEKL